MVARRLGSDDYQAGIPYEKNPYNCVTHRQHQEAWAEGGIEAWLNDGGAENIMAAPILVTQIQSKLSKPC